MTLSRVSGEHKSALALGTTSVTASEGNGNSADWVYQTPKAVSVITQEQIARRAPRHAADMLEETPAYTPQWISATRGCRSISAACRTMAAST